jgi:hypothetical protein
MIVLPLNLLLAKLALSKAPPPKPGILYDATPV